MRIQNREEKANEQNSSQKVPTFNEAEQSPLWARFVNNAGGFLRSLGMRSPRLDFESVSKKAGFRPTKEDEAFLMRFNISLDDADKAAETHFIGRLLWRNMFVAILRNRTLIHQWLRDHPETLQIPIEHPLFIIGPPRTGTTFLYNLLAQDPVFRVPLSWELMQPAPPHDPSTNKPSPLTYKAERLVRLLKSYRPFIFIPHQIEASAPEDCDNLLLNSAFSLSFLMNFSQYFKEVMNSTREAQIEAYAEYYRHIQILQFYFPNRRWLSKNLTHSYFLDVLASTFPTAHLVCTHRDPMEQIPSFCSIYALNRRIVTDQVDPKDIGEKILEWWQERYQRSENARKTIGHRIIDVTYPALMKDPLGVVKDIYAKAGYPFTPIFEERMQAWLAAHPQHKHGIHRYSLEQFGLDRTRVEEVTKEYRQKYLM